MTFYFDFNFSLSFGTAWFAFARLDVKQLPWQYIVVDKQRCKYINSNVIIVN